MGSPRVGHDWKGFSSSSAGKEFTRNAGDPGLIYGSGRSPGEQIGYPLQYSWASLVAQLVKNLPAMQETWVWFLSWGDPVEKGKATHSSILAWRISWTTVHGVTTLDTTKQLSLLLFMHFIPHIIYLKNSLFFSPKVLPQYFGTLLNVLRSECMSVPKIGRRCTHNISHDVMVSFVCQLA